MVSHRLQRRALLGGMAVATLVPSFARAAEYIDLAWEDLLPEDGSSIPFAFRDLLPHDEEMPQTYDQPESTGVRSDWNGKTVRIPGFIVPMDFRGSGVTAFILVPYVGACIHVPPPPANQLVFVTTSTPYESDGMFEAVSVIGKFSVSTLSTYLADVGYGLAADEILPYRT